MSTQNNDEYRPAGEGLNAERRRGSNRMPVEAAFVAIAINLVITLASTVCLAAMGNRSGERIVRDHSEPAFTAKENLSWTPAPLLS